MRRNLFQSNVSKPAYQSQENAPLFLGTKTSSFIRLPNKPGNNEQAGAELGQAHYKNG